MNRELDIIEINAEILVSVVEQPLIELNELSLSLIGGGGAIVTF
jgi:hypothetical protein